MKTLSLVLFLGLIGYSVQEEPTEALHCTFKTCGIDLLNFSDLSFGSLFQKVHVLTFCIRECSPPPVHEFFQSLTFLITKRISGVCSGNACIEKNRFIALGYCAKNRTWPLIQCGTKLVDLVQLALEPVPSDVYKNKTCNTVIDTMKCVENNLARCGPQPISLFKEVLEDLVEIGLNIFCHKSYKKAGIDITVPESERTTAPGPTVEIRIRDPVAKGYKSRKNGAASLQTPIYALLGSIAALLFTIRAMG